MKCIKSKNSQQHHRRLMLFSLCLMVFSASFAQDYQITRHVIGNGGGKSEFAPNVGFSVTGTIGQPITGMSENNSAGFTLTSGFWPNQNDLIFTNGFDNTP